MASVATQLETSRQALLDLSSRNRLISTPRKTAKTKTIEVVDELATEVYRLLVKEGKTLSFLPGREKQKIAEAVKAAEPIDDDVGELPQPDDSDVDERGIAKRHADHRLQTLLTSEGLQKRLLSLFYDAKTFEEEQGVNILYLAVGMLKWYEAPSSDDARFAPLLLIPVSLERGTAAERFKLRWRNEECATNLSLQAKMKAEFGLALPDLATDEDVDVTTYMKAVQATVSAQGRFEVMENVMVLGFFSFAKFLMYRDLDPANWPEPSKIDGHPLICGLMCDGFPAADGMIDEEDNVDKHLSPANMLHVVDADSSQTLAIEEVKRGRNLVIQGPPGTGKSQTITNIIASAVAEGKTVLFVAEKMSALEVVYRRMAAIGLGPLCLELHSHKANKRAVLDELKQTRELGRPRASDGEHKVANWIAGVSCFTFFFGFRMLNAALEERGTNGTVWIVVFFVSRWIMTRENKTAQMSHPSIPDTNKRLVLFWSLFGVMTVLVISANIKEVVDNASTIFGALIVIGVPLAIIYFSRKFIGSALSKTSSFLWKSPAARVFIAAQILWLVLLLFSNSMTFRHVFDFDYYDEDRFAALAILPPLFILISMILGKWAWSAFKKIDPTAR